MSIKSMMYMAMMMAAAASEMHNGKRIYGKSSYTDLGDYRKSNAQRYIKHDVRIERVFKIKGKEIKAYSKKDALKRYEHKYNKK